MVIQRLAGCRTLMTSASRFGGHGDHHLKEIGGVVGVNIPFGRIVRNRYKLAALITAWCGSAFAFPFLMLRFQLKKK